MRTPPFAVLALADDQAGPVGFMVDEALGLPRGVVPRRENIADAAQLLVRRARGGGVHARALHGYDGVEARHL